MWWFRIALSLRSGYFQFQNPTDSSETVYITILLIKINSARWPGVDSALAHIMILTVSENDFGTSNTVLR